MILVQGVQAAPEPPLCGNHYPFQLHIVSPPKENFNIAYVFLPLLQLGLYHPSLDNCAVTMWLKDHGCLRERRDEPASPTNPPLERIVSSWKLPGPLKSGRYRVKAQNMIVPLEEAKEPWIPELHPASAFDRRRYTRRPQARCLPGGGSKRRNERKNKRQDKKKVAGKPRCFLFS